MLPKWSMYSHGIGEFAGIFGMVFDRGESKGAEYLAALIVAVVGSPAECECYDGSWKLFVINKRCKDLCYLRSLFDLQMKYIFVQNDIHQLTSCKLHNHRSIINDTPFPKFIIRTSSRSIHTHHLIL